MMKLWKKLSLKAKILGMVLTILGIYSVGNVVQSFGLFKGIENEKLTGYEVYASSLAGAVSAQFYERYGDAKAFAMNPHLEAMTSGMTPDLDDYAKLYGIYDLIMVVDIHGNFIASSSRDVLGKSIDKAALAKVNYSNAPWFKAVVEGKTTDDKTKGFEGTYFEDFQVDPVLKLAIGEDRWSPSFSTAVKNANGEIVGVLTNRSNAKWVYESFIDIFEDLKNHSQPSAEVKLIGKDESYLYIHHPADHDGKNEAYFDLNVLGKEKISGEHPDFMEAYRGVAKLGYGFSYDEELKDYQVVGFNRISEPKFIDAIGWTVVVMDSKAEVMGSISSAKFQLYTFIMIMTIFGALVAWFFSSSVANAVSKMSSVLNENSTKVADVSRTMASQATEISEASTEQAAAIQETMAAVDEINAMVEKNAEATRRSKDVSKNSQMAAERGKTTVEKMLSGISDISHSNEEIAQQMETNNKQIEEVVRLIGDIGNKTKVINEIVFQTKLLSFNASVEAARAGEAGKGFAVVAEEVGNLAQMSGNAAQEISTMLAESIQRAESIVSETKERVEKLVSDSRSKVEVGISTAKECSGVLDEIVNNVNEADTLVSEIAVASAEQANGIREISKAVGQLDVATQQNSSAAQAASVDSENLSGQATVLQSVVNQLLDVVQGEGHRVVQNDIKTEKFKLSLVNSPKAKSEKKREAKPKEKSFAKKAISKPQPSKTAQKAVAGSDIVPSSDDSRFEEV